MSGVPVLYFTGLSIGDVTFWLRGKELQNNLNPCPPLPEGPGFLIILWCFTEKPVMITLPGLRPVKIFHHFGTRYKDFIRLRHDNTPITCFAVKYPKKFKNASPSGGAQALLRVFTFFGILPQSRNGISSNLRQIKYNILLLNESRANYPSDHR